VYDAFERLYDGIAVYGSPALYDVAEAYALPATVRAKLHYCGLVVRDPPVVDPRVVRRRYQLPEEGGRLVVATVGSGSDGYPVLEAVLTALARLRGRTRDVHAILVTGPYMPADRRALLQAQATAGCRIVSQADNLELMAAADVVVGMGGYNSVYEALRVARPLVIVPRETHKIEQRIRAETLAAHGLARWVAPATLNAKRMITALEWALGQDRVTHARRVRAVLPSFDGAARLAAYLSRWLDGD
jgi:predicted glycosyltransferase